jgi:enterochelin esterase-like enzyme
MGPTIPAVRRVKSELWRGPRATPAPDTARALHGRLVDDTIRSRFLPAPRGVTVYVPPARGAEPIAGVVYLGDGQSVRGLAAEVDTLVAAGRLPRLLLVGMHCDTARGDGTPEQDGRMLEYLSGIDDSTRFLAHERFFLEEVLPWAERGYGAPTRPEQRAVFGFSNSAAFAIDMGLRHPDVFGRVLAFSPAGKKPVLPTPMATPAAAFFLLGGLYEQPFHEKAVRWGALFRAHDVRNTVREVVAGHDWEQWRTSLPEALAWALGGAAPALGAR